MNAEIPNREEWEMYSTSTPFRRPEPATLLGKLQARESELAELYRLSDEGAKIKREAIERAVSRAVWAQRRKTIAETELSKLAPGTVKYVNLCRKLYGRDRIASGRGVSVYEVGTMAYIERRHEDELTLVPCKVTAVNGSVSVQITAARPGLRKGAKLTGLSRDTVIPRDRVENPKSRDYVIQCGWLWAQGA